jgi:amidase
MAIPLAFQSAKTLAARIRRGKLASEELLDLFLARIERYNPKLNAVIATDLKGARKRARAADKAVGKGEIWGPLHGVPMTIKESLDAVRMPTTCGLPEFKDNYPKLDALAVERFRNAGAVLFG